MTRRGNQNRGQHI